MLLILIMILINRELPLWFLPTNHAYDRKWLWLPTLHWIIYVQQSRRHHVFVQSKRSEFAFKSFRLINHTETKSFLSQLSSFTASKTGVSFPSILTVAERTSGNCVDEWLPQIVTFLTASGETFRREAIWPLARLWSKRVKQVKFSREIEGA